MKSFLAVEDWMERLLAVGLVILFSVPLFTCWICIVLCSQGPGFVREPRTTMSGREVRVFKFRTRTTTSRKTFVGRILDRYSLTEMPMLLNVACGEIAVNEWWNSQRCL